MVKFVTRVFCIHYRLAILAALLLQWSCASSPPETTPISRSGGSDATVADSPCSEAGIARLVAAGANKPGVELLCSYRKSLISSEKKYVYRGTGEANVLMRQIDSSGSEVLPKTETSTTTKLVSYSGLLVSSADIAAIVDVIRFQAFFPTEFKAQFEVDPLVTYSPAGQGSGNFASTSYNFKKTGSDGLGDVNYDGRLQVLSFGDGSYAVVDVLDRKVSGSLEQYNGVVLYFAYESNTAVVGRSEQSLLGQNQSAVTVAANVQAQIKKSIVIDYKNYARAQQARQFMETKRLANAGK